MPDAIRSAAEPGMEVQLTTTPTPEAVPASKRRRRQQLPDTGHDSGTVVILRPVGRGNWDTVELRITGRRAPLPLSFEVNGRLTIADQTFRVAAILSV